VSKIRIVNGPYRGREKTLAEKPLTIGRDVEAGIQILDRSASRFHAEIFPVGGMWFVRDLDSKNGTFVNDDRLGDEELLREGDVIKIGTTELAFESGIALADDDSSNRIAYQDDPDMLSNTLEFRLDEMSDIDEIKEEAPAPDNARSLRILYQAGRLLSEPGDAADKETKVLDCLVSAMPAESALIFRRDPASGKLVPVLVRTANAHVHPVISRSIIKKTFNENKALHSANAQEDERFARNASVVQKGIRSVICVPLTVGGHTKGVLYLSRGVGATPFDQIDLELISACAIQLGLAQHAAEQSRRHRAGLNQMMTTMVRVLELRAGCAGLGERCARSCAALAEAARLNAASRERLRQAGLLHHFDRLCGDDATARAKGLALLEAVEDLENVLPLVRLAHERLDGTGPLHTAEDGLDIEARILAVTVAFEERTAKDPGADPNPIIEALMQDAGLDNAITKLLQGCHLDGSLYGKDTAK
jgi:pSer/pThr/pTyr-binding forkhead associated (FHA) protein